MYVIRMKNCAFFARHGVLDEEEGLGQRFYVDASLTVEPGRALVDDAIGETVNYGVAFTVIEEIITGHRRFLIEALALEVAKALSGRFPRSGKPRSPFASPMRRCLACSITSR
ncbi:dihydroneopterin aldolase [Mesorhizobium australicum WSM2073]|uniref:7,8-dihydroneopterin aldolase n=1 Tax=Mesorhizobium australicum (strain HAMBI 3006 / LMG 24608 / WSM2073) TaxID=754035 RepID=L0KQ92_MESAW|nr:dihydroneopterin aldolase [Mesorhizobium australicum WSM2073]